MMFTLMKKSSKGMTLVELSAMMVVVGIIALGMTSGAQAVMLHYQTDTVRQDLRQYGNTILREITRELNLAQKIEIDSKNGFSQINLYENFVDQSPNLTISCHARNGIEFNDEIPLNGVLKLPSEGVFRGNGQRSVYVKDFIVKYETDNRPNLYLFKKSFIHVNLILAMDMDVMDEGREITEEHTYHRTIFLGTSFIQKKRLNSTDPEDDDV